MPAWLDKLLARQRVASSAPAPAAPVPARDAQALLRDGNSHLDAGRLSAAQACYEEALQRDPMSAPAAVNLGFLQLERGLQANAQASLRRALEIDPTNPDALFMLGRLELQIGDPELARAMLDKAVQSKLGFTVARLWLARAHAKAGDLEGAADVATAALACDPDPAEAADLQVVLGQIRHEQRDWPHALPHFEAALARDARHATARIYLASVLSYLSRADEARRHLLAVLEAPPADAATCHQLGIELQAIGLPERAEAAYRAALQRDPQFAPALQNLGAWLQAHGAFAEALECYIGVTKGRPDSADAWCNLGIAYRDLGQGSRAEECFRRALQAEPSAAAAHAHLGTLAFDRGDPSGSLEHFERALAIDAGALDARSMQLYVMSFSATPENYLAQARLYGRLATERARPYREWLVETSAGSPPPDLLHVGVVSGDLRAHPVGYFIESVLGPLRTQRIAVTAFTTREQTDDTTRRIQSRCENWISLVGLADDQAAARIHAQKVHVLLDLAGHTGHNRLPVFAWRPAPVQATWLGYFASTGVPAMDYLIGDLPTVPDAVLDQFSETVLRLPDTRLCFTPPATDSEMPVSPLPALARGHVTLGCNQHLNKITARVVNLWREVMQALPDAHLRLQNKQTGEATRADVLSRLAAGGIDLKRVALAPPAPRGEYLASYGEVDLLLDTFPFPGGTTTCEALWMGVPTLTLGGQSMLANQGAGMLACVGLEAWIARDERDYVARAVAMATDIDSLARLRQELRPRVRRSSLMDEDRFARNLAQALFDMWQRGPRSAAS